MEIEPSRPEAVRRRQGAWSWIFLLVPPLAWAAQFEIAYVLAPPDRQPEHIGSIRWISLFALAAAATSTWLSYADFRRARRVMRPSDRRSRASLWLASTATGIGLFFCLVITATVLVTWFVSPED
ncbi:MAG TPA: hypothetical protein VK550_32270 [Polyangiaceae bacterium]|nr:hypothetical protein [Polyangiaceae bacterium]